MLKRLAFAVLVIAVAGWFAATPSMATREMAKKEAKACVTCHVKPGDKELNQLGKYYQEHKTLEGYKGK